MKKTVRNVVIICLVFMFALGVLSVIGRVVHLSKEVGFTTETGIVELSGDTYYFVQVKYDDDSYDDIVFLVDSVDYNAIWVYNCRTYEFTFFTESFTVTFDYNDGETESVTQTVEAGQCVAEPEEPVRDGYTFDGWYYTLGSNELEWTFSSPKTKVIFDTILTAHWTAI